MLYNTKGRIGKHNVARLSPLIREPRSRSRGHQDPSSEAPGSLLEAAAQGLIPARHDPVSRRANRSGAILRTDEIPSSRRPDLPFITYLAVNTYDFRGGWHGN